MDFLLLPCHVLEALASKKKSKSKKEPKPPKQQGRTSIHPSFFSFPFAEIYFSFSTAPLSLCQFSKTTCSYTSQLKTETMTCSSRQTWTTTTSHLSAGKVASSVAGGVYSMTTTRFVSLHLTPNATIKVIVVLTLTFWRSRFDAGCLHRKQWKLFATTSRCSKSPYHYWNIIISSSTMFPAPWFRLPPSLLSPCIGEVCSCELGANLSSGCVLAYGGNISLVSSTVSCESCVRTAADSRGTLGRAMPGLKTWWYYCYCE